MDRHGKAEDLDSMLTEEDLQDAKGEPWESVQGTVSRWFEAVCLNRKRMKGFSFEVNPDGTGENRIWNPEKGVMGPELNVAA